MPEFNFYCPNCGNEDVFDVDEDIETLECNFCINGIMEKQSKEV